MRLNIGADKSAAMIINDTGLKEEEQQWSIGSTALPIVQKYKHLGLELQSSGCWHEWLKSVVSKTKQRTLELARWGRSNHITLDILSRLMLKQAQGGAWQ